MRYLIFTNTPAHVHLYRNLVDRLEEAGHSVLVLGRDYGCTRALLDHYELPYELYGQQGTSFGSLLRRAPGQFLRIFGLARRYDPDVIFGRGAYAVAAGIATGTKPILVLDSEPSDLSHRTCSRFARAVYTPDAFAGDLGSHHYRFDGVTECAYLHPAVFEPDPSVRDRLGLEPDEPFVIVRFNAFDALHDVRASGDTTDRQELIERLAESATVFVSDEGGDLDFEELRARPYSLHPGSIHDAMAEASLLVADTGTMVTEAALLGTPAVRFVDDSEPQMGEFAELERHGLVIEESDFESVCAASQRLLTDETVSHRWQRLTEQYFEGRPNLTDLLYQVASHPDDPESVSQSSPSIWKAVTR